MADCQGRQKHGLTARNGGRLRVETEYDVGMPIDMKLHVDIAGVHIDRNVLSFRKFVITRAPN
jgi:hypothetical protein